MLFFFCTFIPFPTHSRKYIFTSIKINHRYTKQQPKQHNFNQLERENWHEQQQKTQNCWKQNIKILVLVLRASEEEWSLLERRKRNEKFERQYIYWWVHFRNNSKISTKTNVINLYLDILFYLFLFLLFFYLLLQK